MSKKDSFKGIPKNAQLNVRLRMAVAAAEGEKLSPQAAYAKHLAVMKADAEKVAAASAERKADQEKAMKARAHEAIRAAVRNLASVRDLLNNIERGELNGFCAEDLAMFARAALNENCTAIEESAVTLCIFPARREKHEGYFSEAVKY